MRPVQTVMMVLAAIRVRSRKASKKTKKRRNKSAKQKAAAEDQAAVR